MTVSPVSGLDFTHPVRVETCLCDHMDYRCDWGFLRGGDKTTSCVADPQFGRDPYAVPAVCPQGSLYNMTKGYTRITGDVCEGGLAARYETTPTGYQVSVK